MAGRIKNIVLCGVIAGLIGACSPQKRMQGERQFDPGATGTLAAFCDSAYTFKTLYIKGIEANIAIDDEEYNSRVSLYYLPDSLVLLSAVNAGFEIVRIGVFPDSTVYINRLDKVAVVIRAYGTGNAPPVLFGDLERLVNNRLLCESRESLRINDSTLLVDRSEQDISKKIYYRIRGPQVWKFEFFQKKTGEYVVGEMKEGRKIVIYSNYIVDDLTLQAEGGDVEYDRIIDVNLSVNKRKYNIVHLE
jgi:hypothetical protein